MGGSSLGIKAIYSFLKPKIKKNLFFIDNINTKKNHNKKNKILNIIISKSGNTLETISNFENLKSAGVEFKSLNPYISHYEGLSYPSLHHDHLRHRFINVRKRSSVG